MRNISFLPYRVLLAACWLIAFTSIAARAQCGNDIICASQCVPLNTRPALLHGRALDNTGGSPSDHGEGEVASWQRSYDNVNWTTMLTTEATPDYQPDVCTQTTYYRRLSYHYLYKRFFGYIYDFYTDLWYTSNTVTITPTQLPAPSPQQATYATCGSPVAVASNPVAGATSYNWWVPYAGWGVSNDGNAPFSTYNTNSSFVTAKSRVVVTPAAGAAAGTYRINFSVNSPCGGPKSVDGYLDIRVDYTATPAPASAYFSSASNNVCYPLYNLVATAVPGATSYQATLNDGSATTGQLDANSGNVVFDFRIQGPRSNISATVVAYGTCGTSAPYTVPLQDLAGPDSGCGPVVQDIRGPYPNPTADQVTIQGVQQGAQVSFYDEAGIARKTVTLQGQNTQTAINVRDLPAGNYHVRVSAKGKDAVTKQLVIKH